MNINDEAYVVVQGWMINRLKLKGNELMIYAIIYGFTQMMGDQWFTGSRQYLADWTNTTKPSVDKALKSLVDKKMIVKREKMINNVKFVDYQITDHSLLVGNSLYRDGKETLPEVVKELSEDGKETLPEVAKELSEDGKDSLHHNIEHILDNKIEDNKKEKKENPAEAIQPKKTNFDIIISEYTENEELKNALNDFIKMRKAIKAVITDRALKGICNKLDTLAKTDEEKIKILDQSIMNSWKGVFPLKEGYNAAETYDKIVRPDTSTGGRSDYHVTDGLI